MAHNIWAEQDKAQTIKKYLLHLNAKFQKPNTLEASKRNFPKADADKADCKNTKLKNTKWRKPANFQNQFRRKAKRKSSDQQMQRDHAES